MFFRDTLFLLLLRKIKIDRVAPKRRKSRSAEAPKTCSWNNPVPETPPDAF
jgi:hypothetical protein